MWLIGECQTCSWYEARVRTDEWTHLRVTEEMLNHSEATGHHCRMETYSTEYHTLIGGETAE